MARVPRNVITISPPNLDRTGFLGLEKGLAGPDQPTGRDWLISRLSEGLQVRMLRPPLRGFVEFAPGRVSWRPITRAETAVVIECLKVDEQAGRAIGISSLLNAIEDWTRYFGFSSVLLPLVEGSDAGLAAELRHRGFVVVDETRNAVQLWARIVQGPVALPMLPQDWQARASRLGPGLVVQSVGDSDRQRDLARELIGRSREVGLLARHDRLTDVAKTRARLACPHAMSCVVLDGELLGDCGWSVTQLWQEIRRRKRL